MRTTMKKRFAKGILAAAFAFAAVFSVPEFPLNAEPVTAHAACSHHCQHYSTCSDWEVINEQTVFNFLTPIKVRTEIQTEYSVCSNCGYKKYYTTHCRRVNTVARPMHGTNAYYFYEYIDVVC